MFRNSEFISIKLQIQYHFLLRLNIKHLKFIVPVNLSKSSCKCGDKKVTRNVFVISLGDIGAGQEECNWRFLDMKTIL